MITNRVRRKKVRATFFLFFFYALFVTLLLHKGKNPLAQKTKREKDRSSDSKVTKTDNKLIRYEKTTNHDNESSWRDGESVLCEL